MDRFSILYKTVQQLLPKNPSNLTKLTLNYPAMIAIWFLMLNLSHNSCDFYHASHEAQYIT